MKLEIIKEYKFLINIFLKQYSRVAKERKIIVRSSGRLHPMVHMV